MLGGLAAAVMRDRMTIQVSFCEPGVGRGGVMVSEAALVSRMKPCKSGGFGAAHLSKVGEKLVELVVVEDAVAREVVGAADRRCVREDLVDGRR